MLHTGNKGSGVIAVDFDDVVSNFNVSFSAFHNREFGTKVKFSDIHNYQLGLVYGVDETVIMKRIMHFCHHYHDELRLIDGVKEGLISLNEQFDLQIVTSRKDTLRVITENWISQYLPHVFSAVHFTGSFGDQEITHTNSKSTVCKEIGAVVLIEDALHHALEASDNDVPTILVDNPWNQGGLPDQVTRVRDWSEITPQLVHRVGG